MHVHSAGVGKEDTDSRRQYVSMSLCTSHWLLLSTSVPKKGLSPSRRSPVAWPFTSEGKKIGSRCIGQSCPTFRPRRVPSLSFPFNTLAGVLRLPLASGLLTITDPFFFFGAPFTFFFCFCTDMTVACLLSVWPAPLSQLHPPPPPHHTSPPIPPTIPNLPPLPSCSDPTLCTDCGH